MSEPSAAQSFFVNLAATGWQKKRFARVFGVHPFTLSRWSNQAKRDGGAPAKGVCQEPPTWACVVARALAEMTPYVAIGTFFPDAPADERAP